MLKTLAEILSNCLNVSETLYGIEVNKIFFISLKKMIQNIHEFFETSLDIIVLRPH